MSRQETRTITIYRFDELSEDAKAKARDRYREHDLDHGWWEYTYDYAMEMAELLGIEVTKVRRNGGGPGIFFSGFCSQGDGACFEGTYAYRAGWRKALMAELGDGEDRRALLSIGHALQQAQAPFFYKLKAWTKQDGHYMHSGCMSVMVEHDEDSLRYLADAEHEVTSALREFADWIYTALERDYDYRRSDETVDQALADLEFTEDGRIYP